MLGSGGEQANGTSLAMFAFSLRQSESMASSVCSRAPVVSAHFLLSGESVGPFLPSPELKPHFSQLWSLDILNEGIWTEKACGPILCFQPRTSAVGHINHD